MRSVLVTGPSGLLGSSVVRVFREAGFSVHAYERDITDREALKTFVSGLGQLNAIIHTAAVTDVNRCEKEPEWCMSVNVEGTRNVCEVAERFGARLVYVSTVSVFSGTEGAYKEGDQPDPKNQYNISKYNGEQIVAEYERSLIVRLNLIGVHPEGSRGKNFVEWILDSIRGNRDMNLFTDVRINPLSNLTIAELLLELLERAPNERLLHLGSCDLMSKADIAQWFIDRFPSYTGTATRTTSDALSAAAFRPKEMWLNVDKAAVVLGRPLPTLEHELERMYSNLPTTER
jgi:dTDP-4-dehydrorhamnose reductase